MPIEPGFAMTAHKAQGQTMDRVVVDLVGCSGTEQPYAMMVSRSTSIGGLVVLRDFDLDQITKRRSEDLWKEFSWLEGLRLRTIIKYGSDGEAREARGSLAGLGGAGGSRKRKTMAGESGTKQKKARAAI